MSRPTTSNKARKYTTRSVTKATKVVNTRQPSPPKTRTSRATRAKAATNDVAPQTGPSTVPRRVTRSTSKAATAQIRGQRDDHRSGLAEEPVNARPDASLEEADDGPSTSYSRATATVPKLKGTRRPKAVQAAANGKPGSSAGKHHNGNCAAHAVPRALLHGASPAAGATPEGAQTKSDPKPIKYTVLSDPSSAFPYLRNVFYPKMEDSESPRFTLAVAECDDKEAIALVFHHESIAPSQVVPCAEDEDVTCLSVRNFMHNNPARTNRVNRVVHDLMAVRSLNDPTLREELPTEDRKRVRRRQRAMEDEQQRIFSLNKGHLAKQVLLDGKRNVEAATVWFRAVIERNYPGRKPSDIIRRRAALKYFEATLLKFGKPFWKVFPAHYRRFRRRGHRPKTFADLGFPDEPEQPSEAQRRAEQDRRDAEPSDYAATDCKEGSSGSEVPSAEYETHASDLDSSDSSDKEDDDDDDDDELASDASDAAPFPVPAQGTKRTCDAFEGSASTHASRKRARKEPAAWAPRTDFFAPPTQRAPQRDPSSSPPRAPSLGSAPWRGGLASDDARWASEASERAEPAAGPSAVKREPVEEVLPPAPGDWLPAPPVQVPERDEGKKREKGKPRKRKANDGDYLPGPDFAARATPPANGTDAGGGKGKARVAASTYDRAAAPSPQLPQRALGTARPNVAPDGFVIPDGRAPWARLASAPVSSAVPSAGAKGKRRAGLEVDGEALPAPGLKRGAKRGVDGGEKGGGGGVMSGDGSEGGDGDEGKERAAKRRRHTEES